jgi:two-component system, NtrC family, response regulator GlrR
VAQDWQLTTEPLRTQHADRVTIRRFRLTVEAGPDRGKAITSDGDRVVIGTHDGADLRLTDRAVSRYHCELVLDADAVVLTDLQSRNGTALDSVPIRVAPLRDGAVILVGASRLTFSLAPEHAEIPLAMTDRFGRLVGIAPATRAVMAQLARVAPTESTVLLEGETGTGKEVASESLHGASARRDGPLLIVDCGALPADLLEAELFGYVEGAFTGATADKAGVFEAAAGGTVLLDEIGELSLALQPKLLRALEAREIRRIGESTHRKIDVRIIAATNRDLRAEVNSQRFRADLYYRLAVFQIRLPPLRERAADLPLLVDALLADLGMASAPVAATLRTADAREQLAAHAWPGNVRELRNYLERCVALRAPLPPAAQPAIDSGTEPDVVPFKTARDRATRVFEHAYLVDLLARHGGNVTAAARAAGVDRIYLYRLLWRHGLRDRS